MCSSLWAESVIQFQYIYVAVCLGEFLFASVSSCLCQESNFQTVRAMNIVKVENEAGEPSTSPLLHKDVLTKMKVEVDDADGGDTRELFNIVKIEPENGEVLEESGYLKRLRTGSDKTWWMTWLVAAVTSSVRRVEFYPDEEPTNHGSTFSSGLIDAPQLAGPSNSVLNRELPSSTSSSRMTTRNFTRFRANRKRKLGVCVEFTKTLREMQRKQLEWDANQRELDREERRRRDQERREEKRWCEEEERRREDEERRLDEERRRDEEERRRDRESFFALNAQLISSINNVATALIAKRRPK